MSSIDVQDVCFAYDREPVLQNISMRIGSGDFVCLLGESGCGKSTFLRLAAGLDKPDSGRILMDGKPLAGPGLDRGVVFQDYSLFPWLSTGANIMLSLRQKFRDCSRRELREKILRSLRDVGLDESVYAKYPFELSGGMRQRCAICRAFALDPPALLMDEPFGALDAVTRGRLQQMILDLWKKDEPHRKTILFVTHDVDEALLLATRIMVFGAQPGRIIYEHTFGEGEKPPRDRMFESPHILELRNRLIGTLNRDITDKL